MGEEGWEEKGGIVTGHMGRRTAQQLGRDPVSIPVGSRQVGDQGLAGPELWGRTGKAVMVQLKGQFQENSWSRTPPSLSLLGGRALVG